MATGKSPPDDIYRKDLSSSARHFPRQIAESLQSQSQLLHELMDCVDNLVMILDPSLRVVQANRYATSLLGFSASELVAKPLTLLLEAGQRGRMAASGLSSRVRWGGKTVFLSRSCRTIPLSISLSPLWAGSEEAEEPKGYLLVGRPTDEHDPSRMVDPSNGLVERMLKGFAEPVFIIEGSSRTVRDCNEAALATFGFTLDEFVGRRLFDHARSEDERRRYEALMARADEVYATSGVFQERLIFSNKAGAALPCDIVGLPFFRPDGSLALVIVMLFDRSREEEGRSEIASLVGRVNELAAELSSTLSRHTETIATTCLSGLGFTKRQVEIARLIALGASSKDIGFRLGIAESTVKNHLSVMYRKLDATSKMSFMHVLAERRIRIA